MSDRACAHCGGPIEAHGRGTGTMGRPPKFCSVKCKDDARVAELQAARVAGRPDRKCRYCGGPIDPAMNDRTLFCSRACGMTWRNRKRAADKNARKLANRQPCQTCGGKIPDDVRIHARYCSEDCQQQAVRTKRNASGKHRAYMRQYLYGVTAEGFQALLASQDGKCAICGTDNWPGKGPHLDHDHATGKPRGILCGGCNNGLGNFDDDPARLRAAADYLERSHVLSE